MSLADVHADAVRTLTTWRPTGDRADDQEALRHGFLAFLDARADGASRACTPGHLTASAVVLSHDASHVLLTLHPRVGRWIQLGGHCEDTDTTLAGAALREAVEESGIPDLVIDPAPLHLDVHPITCSGGVPTRHLDVRFVLRAPAHAREVRSDESTDLRWWPVDELPTNVDTVPSLVQASLAREWQMNL